jgi:protein-S-isoprenylcysteine O-methyltransferase Ste14
VTRPFEPRETATRTRARSRVVLLLLFLGVFSVVAPPPAQAYIDPLSGSIVFQVIIAGVLGALLTVRRWWASVVRLVRGLLARVAGR